MKLKFNPLLNIKGNFRYTVVLKFLYKLEVNISKQFELNILSVPKENSTNVNHTLKIQAFSNSLSAERPV